MKRDKLTAKSFSEMKQRCLNPGNHKYPDYGGRGICVWDGWLGNNGYDEFVQHVGCRPTARHSIGRINNDGNYEPGNVRWETIEEQAKNKRNNLWIEAFGETLHLSEWSRRTGIKVATIWARLRTYRWDAERALTPESRCSVMPERLTTEGRTAAKWVEWQGCRRKLNDLAAEFGLKPVTVHARLRSGFSLEQSLTMPLSSGRKPKKEGVLSLE